MRIPFFFWASFRRRYSFGCLIAIMLAGVIAALAASWWDTKVAPTFAMSTARDLSGDSPGRDVLLRSREPLFDGFEHGFEIGQDADFVRWFESDRTYLAQLVCDRHVKEARITERLKEEASFLRDRIVETELEPSYQDKELGFRVYDAQTTGWLHVLDIAVRARTELAAPSSSSALPDDKRLYQLNDGTQLYEADPERLPEVSEVVDTLRGMGLPQEAFSGYRVYLLPFSMGDTSGLGTSGYALIGAPALGREVIPDQVPVTVAHEFGHHIQLTWLGESYRSNPSGWRRYMRLRGIPGWVDSGQVNSSQWLESTEETYAEDVRVLFGPVRAAGQPHASAYHDPREDPALSERLREMIRGHAAACGRMSGGFAKSPWASSMAGSTS